MLEVLVAIRLIEWFAKDLHYDSNGESFYALHLLADKVDFGTAVDDLKEAYWLGAKNELPPSEIVICESALALAKDYIKPSNSNTNLVDTLRQMCSSGILTVERAKNNPDILGGVQSILDGISQTMLVINGLCWRIMNTELN